MLLLLLLLLLFVVVVVVVVIVGVVVCLPIACLSHLFGVSHVASFLLWISVVLRLLFLLLGFLVL